MSNLIPTPALAPLLDRLFAEAEAAAMPEFANVPTEDRERLMRSRSGYRELYGQLKDAWLPVSPQTGALLYLLVRATRARHVVEFGTSFGISTLHMAAALRENGGGHLITSEFEPSKVVRARAHLAEAGLEDLVEIREGDALVTLASGLPESIDLVLLDGHKALYPDVLDLLVNRLRPGAVIIADNANYSAEYLARVRAPSEGFLSLPFADDVELTVRLA